jgi:hypothetical protein
MSKPLLFQVVERARMLVANRGTWTNHALARSFNSEACDPTDARAVRYCAFGALVRAAYDLTGDKNQAQKLAGHAAARMTGVRNADRAYREVYVINDGASRTAARKAVLDLFDKVLVQV